VSAPAHSPAPFRLVVRKPTTRMDPGGYIILDRLGDSIGGLAAQTGDHPAEEQLANAHLFKASPDLLAAAKLGRAAIAQDLELTIEGHTVPLAVNLAPDLSTLDAIAGPIVAALEAQLAQIDAAIRRAEGSE